MKVCIVGAGAIGGFLGTKLAAAGGVEVNAFARGATLDALRTHGWRLRTEAGPVQAPATASDRPQDLGVHDLVIVAVKTTALAQVIDSVRELAGPHGMVMPAMNGVPWWFCQPLGDAWAPPLESVDPGGRLAAAVPLAQVLGCVVHASTATPEPGVVQHRMGQGLIIGEAAGGKSTRAQDVVDVMRNAGFDATHTADVRQDIWYKLWGNMTMNPVSAMTGATVDRILDDPLVRAFCSAAMEEAATIGRRIGCPIEQRPEERHVVTSKLGAFRTSMLQDVDAGRVIELDALVAVVGEMGVRVGVATPNIDALMGLTRLFGRTHGIYPIPGAASSAG